MIFLNHNFLFSDTNLGQNISLLWVMILRSCLFNLEISPVINRKNGYVFWENESNLCLLFWWNQLSNLFWEHFIGCVMSLKKIARQVGHQFCFDFCPQLMRLSLKEFVKNLQENAELSYLFWTFDFWFHKSYSNNTMWPFIPYKLRPRLDCQRQPNMPTMSKWYFHR